MLHKILILAALLAPGPALAQGTGPVDLNCAGERASTVVMMASGETLTVATRLSPRPLTNREGEVTGYDWPVYDHSVTRSDGTELIAYSASKLYDDVGPISCGERLDTAHRELAGMLAGARRLDLEDRRLMSETVRIGQLAACLGNPAACDVEPHYANPSGELRELGADRFQALIASRPVILTVYRSAYIIETYAYAPGERTLVLLETGGC